MCFLPFSPFNSQFSVLSFQFSTLNSLHPEIQQFPFSNPSFQAIVDGHFPYAFRGAGVDDVSHFQGHELGNVGNDFVNGENHLTAVSTLNRFPIQIQMEIKVV